MINLLQQPPERSMDVQELLFLGWCFPPTPSRSQVFDQVPYPCSLLLSQAPSSPWEGCGSQPLPADPTQPSQTSFSRPRASNPSVFFLLRDVWMCVEELFTHPAHPQSRLCRELPWEPRAAFAIPLLIKRKKRKPLSITSLVNNLLPQVTTDRILNDSCAGNHVPKDPRGEITGFS